MWPQVWGTGQDQMRIVKQRLLEMIPALVVFLDVDDLEDIGNLPLYLDRTVTVLIFCSKVHASSHYPCPCLLATSNHTSHHASDLLQSHLQSRL